MLGSDNAGLLGFLVVLALVFVCSLLFWAMRRSLSKVPASFDDPADTPEPEKR